jgi:tungstate transport system ATP-binding protein
MSETAFSLHDLRYAYPGATSGPALDLETLRLSAGEITALVGPNGAGKTTLLMTLALLFRPTRGRLEIYGEDPWADNGRAASARRNTVLVTHHPYLFRGSVFDNVAFGLRVRKVPETEWPARVSEALGLVELAGWERKSVAALSAGQAQRVALARALVLRPRVLLLDEPTANIEAGLALRIEAIVREASHRAGATVVFSSHDFSQASRLADEILYLSEGKRVPFSHENCFSGTAMSDGRISWIEPRPGRRILFRGVARGHVTCVINPANIRISAVPGHPGASGPNVFPGRVTRLETTEADQALVRVSGEMTFRVVVPLSELESRGISLSRAVLIEFDPETVDLIGSEPPEKPHDGL